MPVRSASSTPSGRFRRLRSHPGFGSRRRGRRSNAAPGGYFEGRHSRQRPTTPRATKPSAKYIIPEWGAPWLFARPQVPARKQSLGPGIAWSTDKNIRTGRDSNPRYRYRHTGFRDRLLQPLGHLSSERHKIRRPRRLALGARRETPHPATYRLAWKKRCSKAAD